MKKSWAGVVKKTSICAGELYLIENAWLLCAVMPCGKYYLYSFALPCYSSQLEFIQRFCHIFHFPPLPPKSMKWTQWLYQHNSGVWYIVEVGSGFIRESAYSSDTFKRKLAAACGFLRSFHVSSGIWERCINNVLKKTNNKYLEEQ